jgi:glycosyltransferase involved in cell wall biosynthesis
MRQDSVFQNIGVVIPAYRPDRRLISLVTELADSGFRAIVLVDDGSGPAHESVFEEASLIPVVRVLRHAINLGKGAALKTGINYALCEFPGLLGVVTADADGQHRSEDICKVAARLQEFPSSLILGSRDFENDVPLRSQVGNAVTRHVVHWLLGQKLKDTQTGLRGIPGGFAASLLKLTSSGYDFEIDMLVNAKTHSVSIVEEPIECVYEPGNRSSHFNPVIDSAKIYRVLFRFCSASLLTSFVDNLVFYLVYRHGAHLLGSQVAGRSVAVLLNYWMVRKAVFLAKDRHASVFPKYLAVVVASGTVSYASIRLLAATTHLPVLLDKISVESLLFFVNFAVQRHWTFTQTHPQETPPRQAVESKPAAPLFSRCATALLWLALLVPFFVEISGFRSAHLLSENIWDPAGWLRFEYYIGTFAAISLAFGRFGRRYFLPFLLTAVLLCSVVAVGALPVGAVLLFLFSATILGKLVFGRSVDSRFAVLGGMAIWIFAMTLANRLPIHYVASYLVALALPIALGYRESRLLAEQWLDLFRPSYLRRTSEFVAFSLLAAVMIAHWLVVLKPEVSGDGLTMHMAIPFDIATHHAFTFDFRQIVWALMPKGADWCYSVLYVLGGEFAARLLNLAMLAVLGILLFRVASKFVSPAVAMLTSFLFLSTPLVQMVTGSLLVENFVAAMSLGAVAAGWRFYETRSTRYLLLTAVLFGTSISLKFGALAVVVFALPLFAWMIWRARGELRPNLPVAAFCALILLLGIGSIPYLDAYRQSGNPIFPFANDRFHSAYFADDLKDVRFEQPLTWRTPIDLTFRTHRYHEGQNGSFGFQYFLFLPLTLACLGLMRSLRALSAVVIGLGGAILIGATQPNARYFYPALPFLTLGAIAALASLRSSRRILFHTGVAAAGLAGLWNFYFLPSSGWYHKGFVSVPLFSAAGRRSYLLETAPFREVISYVNRIDRDQPIYMDTPQIAGLIPPAYALSWHDYPFWRRVEACQHPEDFYRLLSHLHVQRLIVDQNNHDREVVVQKFLSVCARPEYSVSGWAEMRIRPDCESALQAASGVFPAGKYDETDSRITFDGSWRRSKIFPSTYQQTVTFSNQPGAEIHFNFVGHGLEYVYTKAFNRGVAELLVDGSRKAVVDLYSPETKWQAQTMIDGLAPGHHAASIRVLGKKNSRASNCFVDLDSVVVF